MKNSVHIFLIFLLVLVVDLSLDIYVPALPYISKIFDIHGSMARLTISVNIIGLAISGLFYGALSDWHGRKPAIIVGLCIFLVTTACCYLANDIYTLIIARFFQGLGQGVGVVVGYASIRDVYKGDKYAQIVSILNMVVATSPGLAPVIGGMIVAYSNWKMVFLVMFVVAFCVLLAYIFYFKETLQERDEKPTIVHSFGAYMRLLKNKQFIGYGSIQILAFVWLWNDIATMPFLFIDAMSLPVKLYGFTVTINVVFYIVGTIINQRYVIRMGSKKMMLIGITIPIFTDLLLIMLHNTITLNPVIIQLIWIPRNISLALILGNSITNALNSIPDNYSAKGTALITFLEMSISSVVVYLTAFLYNGTIISTSSLCIICSTISLIIFLSLNKKKGGNIKQMLLQKH